MSVLDVPYNFSLWRIHIANNWLQRQLCAVAWKKNCLDAKMYLLFPGPLAAEIAS